MAASTLVYFKAHDRGGGGHMEPTHHTDIDDDGGYFDTDWDAISVRTYVSSNSNHHDIRIKSTSEKETKKMMTDSDCAYENPDRKRARVATCDKTSLKLLVPVILCCTITCTICTILLGSLMYGYDQGIVENNEEPKIRMPCKNFAHFYPIAAWYDNTDQETNQRFIDAGIRRINNKTINGGIFCEVSVDAMMGRMMRKEFDVVSGQVTLEARDMGPALERSAYNLTVNKISDLRRVKSYNRGLIIQEEGDYFIYFGIELDYKTKPCRKLRIKTSIAHLLFERSSADGIKAILATEHTCVESYDVEKTTGYTGGIFHLMPNDKLFIQVSAPIIVGKSGANFLGLFQLVSH